MHTNYACKTSHNFACKYAYKFQQIYEFWNTTIQKHLLNPQHAYFTCSAHGISRPWLVTRNRDGISQPTWVFNLVNDFWVHMYTHVFMYIYAFVYINMWRCVSMCVCSFKDTTKPLKYLQKCKHLTVKDWWNKWFIPTREIYTAIKNHIGEEC